MVLVPREEAPFHKLDCGYEYLFALKLLLQNLTLNPQIQPGVNFRTVMLSLPSSLNSGDPTVNSASSLSPYVQHGRNAKWEASCKIPR